MARTARPMAYRDVTTFIGRRLIICRNIRAVTQADVARALDMDASTLNKIEKGSRAPSIFNIIAFANYFNISADFLLRGKIFDETAADLRKALKASVQEASA